MDADLPEAVGDDAAPSAFRRIAMAVLWPAFLMAGVQDALVFVVVDPATLHWYGLDPIEWPPVAIHSVTFLLFWLTNSTAGALTQLLLWPAGVPRAWGDDASRFRDRDR
jgi:hypothetical protein